MKGKHYCKRCEQTLSLTKTGAVPAHPFKDSTIAKVGRVGKQSTAAQLVAANFMCADRPYYPRA
jgi:hypothetical protein